MRSLKSNLLNFANEHQAQITIWAVFIKLIFFGLSLSDCLGALVILVTLLALKVILYIHPKRPDLFNEISLVQEQLKEITTRNEQLERDVTAIKFGINIKR